MLRLLVANTPRLWELKIPPGTDRLCVSLGVLPHPWVQGREVRGPGGNWKADSGLGTVVGRKRPVLGVVTAPEPLTSLH